MFKVFHGGDIIVVNFKQNIRVNAPEREKQPSQVLLVGTGQKALERGSGCEDDKVLSTTCVALEGEDTQITCVHPSARRLQPLHCSHACSPVYH